MQNSTHGEASQRSGPWLRRFTQMLGQVTTLFVQLSQSPFQRSRLGRGLEDRHGDEHNKICKYSIIHLFCDGVFGGPRGQSLFSGEEGW